MAKYVELSPTTSFLLIDAAQSVRDSLTMALRAMGLRTFYHASDAAHALEIASQEEPQFIICDRNLHPVSGMEFLKEIREHPTIRHTPFLMLASEVSKDDVLLASEFGIDGYLIKPFVMKDVSQKISQAVGRYRDPNNCERHFELARVHLQKGQTKAAYEAYTILQKQFPNSARTRVGLSRCYLEFDQIENAINVLNEAITLNPMYVHAYHELGHAYLQNENFDEAINAFDMAIKLSPSNPVRYESIANLLIDEKRFENAEDYLMRASNLELVYPNIFAQLGKVLFAQKKMDKAILYFKKALNSQQTNTSFLNSLGICYKEIGNYDEALKHYNLALKFSEFDTKVLFNKALCLISMGETERARKTLASILSIDPSYSKAQEKLKLLDDASSGDLAS